jgi:hypothetical protein
MKNEKWKMENAQRQKQKQKQKQNDSVVEQLSKNFIELLSEFLTQKLGIAMMSLTVIPSRT